MTVSNWHQLLSTSTESNTVSLSPNLQVSSVLRHLGNWSIPAGTADLGAAGGDPCPGKWRIHTWPGGTLDGPGFSTVGAGSDGSKASNNRVK